MSNRANKTKRLPTELVVIKMEEVALICRIDGAFVIDGVWQKI